MVIVKNEIFLVISGQSRDVARCDRAERSRVVRTSRGQAASSVMDTVGHSWGRCGDGSADDAAAFGRGDGGADNETDKELEAWHERLGVAFRTDTLRTRIMLLGVELSGLL